MLRIRLTRIGKKNRAYFRIVVAEHSRPVKGKFIEILGHYDPIKKTLVVKKELVLDWLKKGAKPSNTVAKLLTKQGMKHKAIVITKFHKKPKTKGKKVPTSASTPSQAPKKDEAAKPKENKEADKSEKKSEEKKKVKIEDKKQEPGLDKK
jgi:small subunit ribosomal protein S16